MQTQLVRSNSDRVISGVCGGLANYLGIDSTIIRLIFVLAVLIGGVSPIIYVILWIVMPDEAKYVQSQGQAQPPVALPKPQDPTGEWKYDPYTGERLNNN
jgi:phage shock protein C